MSTRYPARTVISLNGIWGFRLIEKETLEEASPDSYAYDDVMAVPAAFDATPRYHVKRGLALYRRVFHLEQACPNALLRIGSCGFRGRYWIDGREIGASDMPYNAYEFETGPLNAGDHVVTAACDNRFDPERMVFFKPYYDFYGYGGLYREVRFETLPDGIALNRLQVRTRDIETGRVELRVLFRNNWTGRVAARFAFDTDSEPRSVDLDVKDGAAVFECDVPAHRVWSLESPELHKVRLDIDGDSIVETFGIRTFEAADGKLWLNGKPIILRGFNRHESHPECGPATNEPVMLEDLHHLKELHCNFIRGAHYPQDPRFLDLCDSMGFLVWEEGLAWGNTAEDCANPVFADGQVAQMRRMVRKSVNHPCVVLWGFLNEFDSTSDAGVALCKRLVDALHEEDWSRPVTWACNRGLKDRCAPLVDVVSYNTYPGWIALNTDQEPEDEIRPDRDALVAHFRKAAPGKPILVSEMGVCALYGQHDPDAAQWTEEYEARYLDTAIRAVFECPALSGIAIWHLADAMTYHRTGSVARVKPIAQNLAGSYDAYRRAKLSARLVAGLFAEDEKKRG